MTSADWIKVLVAIITFLATSLLAWLGTQIVKYRKLAKGAENETIKNNDDLEENDKIFNSLTEMLDQMLKKEKEIESNFS